MQRSRTRWLTLLVTALLGAAFAQSVGAAPINYTTTGYIGNQSGSPLGNFTYNPTSGTALFPGTLSLGSFTADPLPAGSGMSYSNLPFYINVMLQPQGIPAAPASELSITGQLNGGITGTSSSDVVATVTSVQASGPGTLPFPINSFNFGPQTLDPSGINAGMTTLSAQVNSASVPEPTTLTMMGILAGWVALKAAARRRTARR